MENPGSPRDDTCAHDHPLFSMHDRFLQSIQMSRRLLHLHNILDNIWKAALAPFPICAVFGTTRRRSFTMKHTVVSNSIT
eukprot:2051331-Amphidinium_carterae.1